jgi:peptidoglycan/xylan/chitin deacetylase (PgdA/CDA1 family)
MPAQAERIPVLMYHRVGTAHNDWESRYCISPESFTRHMQQLSAAGHRAVSLAEFFAWLDGKQALPAGSFLLTFDDGFLGVYEHAAPALETLDWPATVFLVSQLIGRKDQWCQAQNPDGRTHPLLSASQIHEMRSSGFEFHSHTRLHPDLTALDRTRMFEELSGSRKDLEDLLGEEVPYVAYPYGRLNREVLAHELRAMVRMGAGATDTSPVPGGSKWACASTSPVLGLPPSDGPSPESPTVPMSSRDSERLSESNGLVFWKSESSGSVGLDNELASKGVMRDVGSRPLASLASVQSGESYPTAENAEREVVTREGSESAGRITAQRT